MSKRVADHYISQITLVGVFNPKPNAAIEHGRYFIDLASKYSGNVTTPAVNEESSPEVPRLVINTPERILALALDRFVVTLPGQPNAKTKPRGAIDEITKEGMYLLLDFFSKEVVKNQFFGIIQNVRIPFPLSFSLLDLAAHIHQVFFRNMKGNRTVVSSSFQIGELVGDHFVNFQVRPYEVRTMNVTPGTPIHVSDLTNHQASERGIELVLDTNNKPHQQEHDPELELRNVYSLAKEEIDAFCLAVTTPLSKLPKAKMDQ